MQNYFKPPLVLVVWGAFEYSDKSVLIKWTSQTALLLYPVVYPNQSSNSGSHLYRKPLHTVVKIYRVKSFCCFPFFFLPLINRSNQSDENVKPSWKIKSRSPAAMAEPDETDLHTVNGVVLTFKSVGVVELWLWLGMNICFSCSVACCINCID